MNKMNKLWTNNEQAMNKINKLWTQMNKHWTTMNKQRTNNEQWTHNEQIMNKQWTNNEQLMNKWTNNEQIMNKQWMNNDQTMNELRVRPTDSPFCLTETQNKYCVECYGIYAVQSHYKVSAFDLNRVDLQHSTQYLLCVSVRRDGLSVGRTLDWMGM